MSAQPDSVTTLERVTRESIDAESAFQHAYCTACNLTRDIAISMCGAKRTPWSMLRPNPDGRPFCAVCDVLAWQLCEVCGS